MSSNYRAVRFRDFLTSNAGQASSVKCLNYSSGAEFMQQFVRIVGNGEILNVGEEKY